jgi:hypothetical protein
VMEWWGWTTPTACDLATPLLTYGTRGEICQGNY